MGKFVIMDNLARGSLLQW